MTSRQKKFDNLVEDIDEPYDEGDYEEEEEIMTKEKIEERYKEIRKRITGEITKKEIMASLEKNYYDIEATVSDLKTVLTLREQEAKKLAEAKKQAEQKKPAEVKKVAPLPKEADQKKSANLEEKKLKVSSGPKSPTPPKDLNLIYPKIEYKGIGSSKDENSNINLVIIGHVDAGKSTMMGHFLYKLGYVSHGKMTQYEKESKLIGKATFQYAWAMDETDLEREKGVTINIAMKNFQLKDKNFTIIDAPGHKDFIPNMISGAAQADCAILVIDSKKNAFEAGFSHGGQTKEHAILARCLGVTQLIVAVNKLDMNEWEKPAFENICAIIEPFLLTIGYKQENIRYIPVSGLLGINLVEKSAEPKLAWYTGPTLSELIYTFKPVKRELDKPIRCCVSDCYTSSVEYLKGTCISAKIEGGVVQSGDKLLLQPLGMACQVKDIMIGDQKASIAKAGDSAEIGIQPEEELDISLVKSGMVLCSIEHPINIITKFKAQIMTFELTVPITLGCQIFIHCFSLKAPAKITKIEKSISDGIEKKNPKCLLSNQTAFVIITAQEKVCLELYANFKGLGRIAIRNSAGTLATGIITELLG